MDDDDKAAIGAFFSAFETVETVSLGIALRSLSPDPQSVDDASGMLDFDARLKLLERMAFACGVPDALMAELEELLLRARKLYELRDEVARTLDAEAKPELKRQTRPSGPRQASKTQTEHLARLVELANSARAASRVADSTKEAVGLQDALRAIAARLALHVTGSDAKP